MHPTRHPSAFAKSHLTCSNSRAAPDYVTRAARLREDSGVVREKRADREKTTRKDPRRPKTKARQKNRTHPQTERWDRELMHDSPSHRSGEVGPVLLRPLVPDKVQDVELEANLLEEVAADRPRLALALLGLDLTNVANNTTISVHPRVRVDPVAEHDAVADIGHEVKEDHVGLVHRLGGGCPKAARIVAPRPYAAALPHQRAAALCRSTVLCRSPSLMEPAVAQPLLTLGAGMPNPVPLKVGTGLRQPRPS